MSNPMFTEQQWKTLSERFNSQSFTGKLLLIKQHSDIFELESDSYNFFLRLKCDGSMRLEYDSYFSFPANLEFLEMRNLFRLLDIQIKELK